MPPPGATSFCLPFVFVGISKFFLGCSTGAFFGAADFAFEAAFIATAPAVAAMVALTTPMAIFEPVPVFPEAFFDVATFVRLFTTGFRATTFLAGLATFAGAAFLATAFFATGRLALAVGREADFTFGFAALEAPARFAGFADVTARFTFCVFAIGLWMTEASLRLKMNSACYCRKQPRIPFF